MSTIDHFYRENTMKNLLAATCIMLASSATAMAQGAPKAPPAMPRAHTSTEAFVQMCANKSDNAAQNFCNGYGQGVYEMYLMTRHPKNAKPFICMDGVALTRQEHIDAFVKWTAANPKYNQLSAADTILRYLGETYPCKK
jgi:hypothetical protein